MEINKIGNINFKDVNVSMYHDPYMNNKNTVIHCWRARNPDSYYQGHVFLNHKTGKISYPKDAVIPKQTDKDREQLPKFIITGLKKINNNFISKLKSELQESYRIRNKHLNLKNEHKKNT